MATRASIRGDRLKRLREERGFTQGQVEAYSGVDRSLISRLERGERANTYAKTIADLARVLNTTADYLLGLTDSPVLPDEEQLTQVEYRCIRQFRELSEADQQYILRQLEFAQRYPLGQLPPPRIIGDEEDEPS